MSLDTQSLKIVVIGGGTGSSMMLRGLKQFTSNLTAVVTMFDSGGSSGLLRSEFGYPPFGDIRQCLMALSGDARNHQGLKEAFDFRFGDESSLNGHNVGNLVLAALTSLHNDLEIAIQEMCQAFNVVGNVVPVTLEQAELCAELADGQILRSESDIDLGVTTFSSIKHIFLNREVGANPRAIQAVTEADAIVFGPGDLYTSILPNLLPTGMKEALSSTKAIRIYVCNLMTKREETGDFEASDFASEMNRYLGEGSIDWVIVNNQRPSSDIEKAYQDEGAFFVEPDLDEVRRHVPGIIATGLAASELPLRHDSNRTAESVFQAIKAGRMDESRIYESSSVAEY